MKNYTLFDGIYPRISMSESIKMTIGSLNSYGKNYRTWAVAWSGGKDSTATLTVLLYLIESGLVKRPENIQVFFADTRMEIPPLYEAAKNIMADLTERGIKTQIVTAPVEKRYLPYILGRGVPPPNNNTFRWCTRQIKVEPMQNALYGLRQSMGEKILTITGVRQGESAIRDGRISMSCSKDGAECGQGWFQRSLPDSITDTLAPILHWRVCHVWEWLKHWAPKAEFGDWDTRLLADAYGGDEAEEINARTGCICCPLASNDRALNTVLRMPRRQYLQPLTRLRNVYASLRLPQNRHRQDGTQRNADGSIPKNPQRMGALTIAARQAAFGKILEIQEEINRHRDCIHPVDLLNAAEINYIRAAWDANLFPNGWSGNEPNAGDMIDHVFYDGSVQPLLFHIDV